MDDNDENILRYVFDIFGRNAAFHPMIDLVQIAIIERLKRVPISLLGLPDQRLIACFWKHSRVFYVAEML
jgi:hypothetical protein